MTDSADDTGEPRHESAGNAAPRSRATRAMVTVLALLAALSAALYWYGFPSQGSTAADIAACVPRDLTADDIGSDAVRECLQRRVQAAVDRGGLFAAAALTAQAEKINPRVSTICHGVAHTAGRRSFTPAVPVAEQLRQLSTPACDWGFLHGVAEEFAYSDPSEDALEAAAKACESPGYPVPVSTCSDALGHVFWITAPEIPVAGPRCRYFETVAAQIGCANGITMMMRIPATDAPRPQPTLSAEDIRAACRAWPEQTDGILAGCGAGFAGTLVSAVMSEATWLQNATPQDMRSSPGRVTEVHDLILRQVDSAVRACRSLEAPPAVAECANSYLHALLFHAPRAAELVVPRFCAALDSATLRFADRRTTLPCPPPARGEPTLPTDPSYP